MNTQPAQVCDDTCRYTDGLCDRHGTGDTPPAHEWREEFDEQFLNPDKFSSRGLFHPKYENGKLGYIVVDIKDFIQKTLDQHSARLVERISEAKLDIPTRQLHNLALGINKANRRRSRWKAEAHNQALDQAIDIIKDKPPTV